jgi:hypothetical protein
MRGHMPPPAGSWRLPSSLIALLLGVLLSGCSLLRDVSVPPLPGLHEIDRVEEARKWVDVENAAVDRDIQVLLGREPLTAEQQERLARARAQLVELAEDSSALDRKEEEIVQGIASDPVQQRKVFDQLEHRITPLSTRYQGLRQELVEHPSWGGDARTRREAEMARLRVQMDRWLHWQNRITAAGSGYTRTSTPGWPVLEGVTHRRLAEGAQPTPASVEDE